MKNERKSLYIGVALFMAGIIVSGFISGFVLKNTVENSKNIEINGCHFINVDFSNKPLKNIDNLDIYFSDDLMEITLFNQIILDITKEEKTIYNTQNIYGDIEYIFEVNGDRYISSSPSIVIDIPLAYFIEIKVYSRYSKAIDITSKPYSQIITTY